VTAGARLDDSYALIGSVAFVLTFRGGQQPGDDHEPVAPVEC
jgi:hypothetical protein